MANLLCRPRAKAIPIGKEKKELVAVKKIVRVSPPQYLVPTRKRPSPPAKSIMPIGIILIQAKGKVFLSHLDLILETVKVVKQIRKRSHILGLQS